MQQLITRMFNGFEIEFEFINGVLMANATGMCAAFGKQPKDWLRVEKVKIFVEARRRKSLLAENQMIVARNGGNGKGTWIHESLILKLAQWLDVEFEIQCEDWLAELHRTGHVSLAVAPALSAAPLLAHTERATQIQNTKNVRDKQFRLGGLPAAKGYYYESCWLVTGKTPAQLREWAKQHRWPSKVYKSGREVIRKARPEVACRMSLIDELTDKGVSVQEATAITEGTTAYFKTMLRLGHTPAELAQFSKRT